MNLSTSDSIAVALKIGFRYPVGLVLGSVIYAGVEEEEEAEFRCNQNTTRADLATETLVLCVSCSAWSCRLEGWG